MNIQFFFDTHLIFRYQEYAEFMQKQSRQQLQSSRRQQLSYYHKAGRLIHIRKFLYAVKPISIKAEDFWIDPYLIAGKATADSVLSYHTALELHNLAYTTFEELTFLTAQPSKSFTYSNQRFRAVSFPKSLVTIQETYHGVEQIQREGIKISITDLERTIVDVLDRPELAGGWEEVWRSLDHVVHFDPAKLVTYTLLLGNATTTAKVGFFLDQRPKHLKIDSKYLKQLIPHIPKQPHYLNRKQRDKGQYIKKWQLIVPLEIIERRWEEPHATDL